MKSELERNNTGNMGKDKKIYIVLVFVIPLTITVFYLTWVKGMPLRISAVCYGIASTLWIVVAIHRARQISRKSGVQRKQYSNKKWQVIERTVMLIVVVAEVINLVYRLINGYLFASVLASILLIFVFGSNAFLLLGTTKE